MGRLFFDHRLRGDGDDYRGVLSRIRLYGLRLGLFLLQSPDDDTFLFYRPEKVSDRLRSEVGGRLYAIGSCSVRGRHVGAGRP